MRYIRRPWPGVLLVVCALFLWSASALAQGNAKKANPTDEQLDLNAQGVELIVKGNPARAVAVLEEARTMGEVNILYLNLGRAYQKLGQCEKARVSFQKAKTAPVVEKPSPRLVRKKADKFLAELSETCDKADTSAQTSDNTPAATPAGEDVQLTKKSVAADSGSRKTWGWVGIGAGGALIGSAVALHLVARSKRADLTEDENYSGGVHDSLTQEEAYRQQDAADTFDTIGLAALIGGTISTGIGTYLLMSSGPENDAQLSFRLVGDGIGLTWTRRF